MALGHWAARRGARYAYLQVDVANQPALRTYERLGFVRHHGYLYLAPPVTRSVRIPCSAPGRSGRSARRTSPA